MKINTITNDRSSNFTPAASKQMGIDEAAMALIIKSVTDMYSDPISAMMREVVSNAIDSHREAGTDVAVEVSLPDSLNPVFTVQDRGIGMSREDMMNTYTTYGRSTKRDSNDAIGGFGYGSKSPLAAVSRFTVEAVKDGKMNTGTIFMDEQSRPSFDLIIDDVDTNEPNGVTVSIPISFIETSKVVRALAGFSATELKINGVSNPHSVLDHESTIMYKDDEVWTSGKGVMNYSHMFSVIIGGVIYPISTHDVRTYFDKMGIEAPQNGKGNLIFRMPIGDVDMAPARENLIYSERTLKAIGDHYQAATEVIFNSIADFINTVDTDNFTDVYEGLVTHRQIVDMFPSLIARTNEALVEKSNGKAVPFYSTYMRNIPFNLGEYADNIRKIDFVSIGMGNIAIPMFNDIFMKDHANLTHYSRWGHTARAVIETTTASALRPALPLVHLGGDSGVDFIVTDTPDDEKAFRNAAYAMRTDGQEAGATSIYFTTQPATALTAGAKHVAGKVISYTDFVQLTKDGMKAVRRAAAKKRENDPNAAAKKRTPINDGFKANTLYASRQATDICTPDGVKFEASSLDKSHTYNISFVTQGNNPYSSSRRSNGLAGVEVEAMHEVHDAGQVYLYTANKSSAKALTARLTRDGYTVTENYGEAYTAANSFKEAIKGKVAKKFTADMALAVILNKVFNDGYSSKLDNFDRFTNKATAKAVEDALESAPTAPADFDIIAEAFKSRYPMLGAFISGGWSMERSARIARVDLNKTAIDYINMVDSTK